MIQKGQMIVIKYLVPALECEEFHNHKAYHIPRMFKLFLSKPTLEFDRFPTIAEEAFKDIIDVLAHNLTLLTCWLNPTV